MFCEQRLFASSWHVNREAQANYCVSNYIEIIRVVDAAGCFFGVRVSLRAARPSRTCKMRM